METINELPTDISTELTYRQGIITLNITKGDYEATN